MELANIVELNNGNYYDVVKTADKIVLVDFWAPWCGPCRAVAPVLERLAGEYPDALLVGKLNVDENREIALSHGISSIPSIFIYKNGDKVDSIVGALPYLQFKAAVERAMGS